MDENKKNERPEDTGNDLSLDEILADIEAERRQAAPNDRQAPAKAAVQAAAPAAKPAADPAVHSGQTGRSGASAAPDFPRAADPAPVHDAVHDAAREPSGAPYLGKKIAEVPLDPEAEKAGEAKRPGERKRIKRAVAYSGAEKNASPRPTRRIPITAFSLNRWRNTARTMRKRFPSRPLPTRILPPTPPRMGKRRGRNSATSSPRRKSATPTRRASSPSGSKKSARRASAGYSRQSRKPAACKPIYFPLLKMR